MVGQVSGHFDPLSEFIDNELAPMLKRKLSKEHFDRIGAGKKGCF